MFCFGKKCTRSSPVSIKNNKEIYDDFINTYDYNTNFIIFINKLMNKPRLANMFLLKSYYLFFFNLKDFNPLSTFPEGLLIQNSVNSKFTIIEKKNKYFLKVVDYDTDADLLIYDIINAIIFDKINNNGSNDFSEDLYKSCLVKYKDSCLSYYIHHINDRWLYNELIDISNTKSKYHFNNLFNLDFDKLHNVYNKKCYISISRAVDGYAKCYGDIIEDYLANTTNLTYNKWSLIVLSSMPLIYEFLEWVGMKYGYIHNDLHSGNILFDDQNNRLIIIDYGRNAFAYFIENEDAEITSKIDTNIYLLNLKTNFNNKSNLTYKDLIESKNFRYKVPTFKVNNSYMGIIFDIITLSLNLYKYIILMDITPIIDIFNKIITITLSTSTTVIHSIEYDDDFFNNYKTEKKEIEKLISQHKNHNTLLDTYTYVIDGLFLFALLLEYLKIKKIDFHNISHKKILLYRGGLQISYLSTEQMNDFLEHLYNNIYLSNIKDLNKCVVLRNLPIPPEQTKGGDRTSSIHDFIMKTHKSPMKTHETHKSPMKTHETHKSPIKTYETHESPMKTHETHKSPIKTHETHKSPIKTHETHKSPIKTHETSIPDFNEDEGEYTTINNMQRYILDKKEKWQYKPITYSKEEIDNSYINLYKYINKNELSVINDEK